jgi:hypothetical protein
MPTALLEQYRQRAGAAIMRARFAGEAARVFVFAVKRSPFDQRRRLAEGMRQTAVGEGEEIILPYAPDGSGHSPRDLALGWLWRNPVGASSQDLLYGWPWTIDRDVFGYGAVFDLDAGAHWMVPISEWASA